ncbi:MAG TPA: HupE/UreJ family protein [Stellaceae bacterium]|nr:HupE/UreJ family protein [Stellaceae bacterium]
MQLNGLTTNRAARAAIILAVLALAMLPAAPASAHPIGNGAGGFAAGFLHPLSGLDHLLAMVSVGIWGVELGAPALWLLPIAFPLVMAVGGALGFLGVLLPGGELLVALSVLVLGACVVYGRRVPLAVALAVVGVFAFAHGHAHGTELPEAADPLAFTIGFVGATGLLHVTGIGIGLLGRFPNGALAIRACGVLIALTGCYFVYSHAGV